MPVMVSAPSSTRTRTGPALAALATGTFAIGMTEFVITGLLPEIATDLAVSIPRAGLLISGYALSVVIGGPIVTGLVARRGRKPVLIALLAFFVIGNAIGTKQIDQNKKEALRQQYVKIKEDQDKLNADTLKIDKAHQPDGTLPRQDAVRLGRLDHFDWP